MKYALLVGFLLILVGCGRGPSPLATEVEELLVSRYDAVSVPSQEDLGRYPRWLAVSRAMSKTNETVATEIEQTLAKHRHHAKPEEVAIVQEIVEQIRNIVAADHKILRGFEDAGRPADYPSPETSDPLMLERRNGYAAIIELRKQLKNP